MARLALPVHPMRSRPLKHCSRVSSELAISGETGADILANTSKEEDLGLSTDRAHFDYAWFCIQEDDQ